MAISTTIVDVSPFSTNGALVLANARGVDRNRSYRQVISYTCVIVALGPVVRGRCSSCRARSDLLVASLNIAVQLAPAERTALSSVLRPVQVRPLSR
ncbi:hypothetical protein [Kibdelosporangium aridum]|uniref:hypothetical protein n=1 Tax=Kibdelosporangium aridum TaxID=2030 RepID=UPI00055A9732|nr:hypothetical protein [Kibdelosporangium aridum]